MRKKKLRGKVRGKESDRRQGEKRPKTVKKEMQKMEKQQIGAERSIEREKRSGEV